MNLKGLIAAALLGILIPANTTAGDYAQTGGILAAGGGRATAKGYVFDTSLGSLAGEVAEFDTGSVRPGFCGQLYDFDTIRITPILESLNESSQAQFHAGLYYDDGTQLPLLNRDFSWQLTDGLLAAISGDGLLSVPPVWTTTNLTLEAAYQGFVGTRRLMVINSLPDNFGAYANDLLPDDWQFRYFRLNNPNAAAAADPDHDGLDNATEYRLGLDPTKPDPDYAPPIITLQPTNQIVASGSTAIFSISATGRQSLRYQWMARGQSIPDATNSTLILLQSQASQSGYYSVIVSNEVGQMTSGSALLTVYGGAVQDDYLVSTFAGQPELSGFMDGPGNVALLGQPGGLKVDSAGNIYVADSSSHTVRKITPGGRVSTLAGKPGVNWYSTATNAVDLLYFPTDVAVDTVGNVFVADSRSHTIRKITPSGSMSYFAGQPGVVGNDDGIGALARFNSPGGLAIDARDNLFLADTANFAIRKITTAGVVSTIVGKADRSGCVDGPREVAAFSWPYGIAVDGAGVLYVTDHGHTLRKVFTNGNVVTLAGICGNPGAADGPGDQARFNTPSGVAVDGAGNLFVADYGSHTIRKTTPEGVVITILGGANSPGTNDGYASQARFRGPMGLAADKTGTLFIADTDNSTIRKAMPLTGGTLRIKTDPKSLFFKNQAFHFEIIGALPGLSLVVESSLDLITWQPVLTNRFPNNPEPVAISTLPGIKDRFYRTRQP